MEFLTVLKLAMQIQSYDGIPDYWDQDLTMMVSWMRMEYALRLYDVDNGLPAHLGCI